MSRSGYVDDIYGPEMYLYRGVVASAMRGKRGQKFLKELVAAMDSMPEKKLIAHDLINEQGEVCAIGAFCKAKNIDVKSVDVECSESVGDLVNIAKQLAAEIEFYNDEMGPLKETPEARWLRMRKWIAGSINE